MKDAILAVVLLSVTALSSHAQFDRNREEWITDLDEALRSPDRVYRLDLSGRGLDSIPEYLSRFPNLEALKLSDNNLREVNDQLGKLSKLIFLELSGNRIRAIDFQRLGKAAASLEELWLRDNVLEELDSTLAQLPLLRYLHLGRNRIRAVDSSLRLRYLEVLTLDGNYLQRVPGLAREAPKLQVLNLYGNDLAVFRLDASYRNLRELNLGDNPLPELTFQPGAHKLQVLILDWVDLSGRDLRDLPASIRSLSLEHCMLTELPVAVRRLPRLRELSLLHNELSSFPVAPDEFRRLEKIWVGGNDLNPELVQGALGRKVDVVK